MSLQEAIILANGAPGGAAAPLWGLLDPGELALVAGGVPNQGQADTIVFDIAGPSGVQVMNLVYQLPAISDPLAIEGSTQSGYIDKPVVVLNGLLLLPKPGALQPVGLDITGGDTTVRSLGFRNFRGAGVYIVGAGGNRIEGSTFGTDEFGTDAARNDIGIIIDFSPKNVIGGAAAGKCNLTSSNTKWGVEVRGPNSQQHQLIGYLIGVTWNALPLGNDEGVYLTDGSPHTTLSGNTIAGNTRKRVRIFGGSHDNTLTGNFLGTNLGGNCQIANGKNGVLVSGTADHNIIGAGGDGREKHHLRKHQIRRPARGSDWKAASTNDFGERGGHPRRDKPGGSPMLEVIREQLLNTTYVCNSYIGLGAEGVQLLGNGDAGVWIEGSPGNLVGGNATNSERNVISANKWGVVVTGTGASNNEISGNLIGTDKTGTLDPGNTLSGVSVSYVQTTKIGRAQAGYRNVISGNNAEEIRINSSTSTQVANNYIGTKEDGLNPLGNGTNGIVVEGTSSCTVIGLLLANLELGRNGISGNIGNGIALLGTSTLTTVQNNFIGTNFLGQVAVANQGSGVFIGWQSSQNTIGTAGMGRRNVLSGNAQYGVNVEGFNDTIDFNYIGFVLFGTTAFLNGSGWRRDSDPGNLWGPNNRHNP